MQAAFECYLNHLHKVKESTLNYTYTEESYSNSPWLYFTPHHYQNRKQGWKVHVTFSYDEFEHLFDKIIPFLIGNRLAFKLPTTLDAIDMLNSGKAGRSQVGKIITIYTEDDQKSQEVALTLDELWPYSKAVGPPSNLYIRKDGAVSLRFGVFETEIKVYTDAGIPYHALTSPTGGLVPDVRTESGLQPAWAPDLNFPTFKQELTKTPSFILGENVYIPIMLLQSRSFMKVYYTINANNGTLAIIKYVPKQNYIDLAGVSVADRLKNEWKILLKLRKTNIAPKPTCFHCNEEGSFLVLEALVGNSYEKLDKQTALLKFSEVIEAIKKVHDCGIVHGDMKLTNILVVKNKIKIIDYETAFEIKNPPKSINGTSAYMAPEALYMGLWYSYDIYAIGTCLEHIFYQKDPGSIHLNYIQRKKLLRIRASQRIYKLINRCHCYDDKKRPSLLQLARYCKKLNDFDFAPSKNVKVEKTILTSTIRQALKALKEYEVVRRSASFWKNMHYGKSFEMEGINLGSAGILLGSLAIAKCLKSNKNDKQMLATAVGIKSIPIASLNSGLFTGAPGMALALTAALSYFQAHDLKKHIIELIQHACKHNAQTDLFVGKAGVLFSLSIIGDYIQDPCIEICSKEIARELIFLHRIERGVVVWPKYLESKSNEEYLTGAAHGSAGIAMALAIYGKRFNDKKAVQLSILAFKSLYKYGTNPAKSRMLYNISESCSLTSNGTWCHGLAGYLWCLLLAFPLEKETKKERDWAISLLAKEKDVKDPTYCHGLSGQLEIWRMVSTIETHRSTAIENLERIALTLKQLTIKSKGKAYWTSDDPEIITPDLWIGFLGPATSLALYLDSNTESILTLNWMRKQKNDAYACKTLWS